MKYKTFSITHAVAAAAVFPDAHVVVLGEVGAVEHFGPREAVVGHGRLAAGLDHLAQRSVETEIG
jgi:hypothetical protein